MSDFDFDLNQDSTLGWYRAEREKPGELVRYNNSLAVEFAQRRLAYTHTYGRKESSGFFPVGSPLKRLLKCKARSPGTTGTVFRINKHSFSSSSVQNVCCVLSELGVGLCFRSVFLLLQFLA